MRCTAIAAVTIDGKIARNTSHFSDWTSLEDKTFMRSLLDASDVVVIGNNTYKTAIEPLSKRNCIVLTTSVSKTERKDPRLLLWNPATVRFDEVVMGYERIAILGGTQTYTYFLEHDLLDEMYLTIEPVVFGNGLNLFETTADITTAFALSSVKQLNERGSVLLHYVRTT